MQKTKLKCWFDGACGPENPGGFIGCGYHIKIMGPNKNDLEYADGYAKSPRNTNNSAEHLALNSLLKILSRASTIIDVQIYGDSNMAINHMNGKWRINSEKFYAKIAIENQKLLKQLVNKGHKFTFKWIPRAENTRADELSKIGIGKAKRGYCTIPEINA